MRYLRDIKDLALTLEASDDVRVRVDASFRAPQHAEPQ
jgi:hypothetical protein